MNILKFIKDAFLFYKAVRELIKIIKDATPEIRSDIHAIFSNVHSIAGRVDTVVEKIQATPNAYDDKLIPPLKTISDGLKRIG